ncbi:TMEM175 family protein [Kibdelosporangium lantanae]|uniref:TMEM175 family protein n=1 Tax=Kibdelosporangium lantanae TaxID=1497396 RepID=A0ABW3M1P4_9PSEU
MLSFAVIARFWMLHHRIFEHVKAYNSTLMWLNTLWLFTIVFLPFPTGLVGSYGTDHFTEVLYVGSVLASSLVQTILIVLVYRSDDLQVDDNPLQATNTANAVVSSALLVVALLLTALIRGVGYYSILVLFLSRPTLMVWGRFRRGSSSG